MDKINADCESWVSHNSTIAPSQDNVVRWFESVNKQLSVASFDLYVYVSNFLPLKLIEKYRYFI